MLKVPKFSKKTLSYLELAARQKRADWLDRNREGYDEFIRAPLEHLASSLKASLSGLAPGYHFPQKGIGRLRRPGGAYKNWISYSASRPNPSRFEGNPNLYFGIQCDDPDGDHVIVAGGLYMPSSRQLRAVREAIAKDASPFRNLFKSKAFANCFKGGFSLDRTATRPPRGFPKDHPEMTWLKLQGFFVWRSYTMREFSSPTFSKLVVRDWKQVLRLNALLDAAVSGLPVRSFETTRANSLEKPKTDLSKTIDELEAPRRPMDF